MKPTIERFKKWLDEGEGSGEWYEPYITNKDFLGVLGLTLIVSCLMIALITLI